MLENTVLKVSEFNHTIKTIFDAFEDVTVEGEISQFSVNQGKWIFLTIKDDDASVEVFSSTFKIKNHSLFEEGMLVHVIGKPSLYEKTGRFSLQASAINPAGEGSLKLAFEKLKQKLTEEGLFDVTRKRKLPIFPQTIGLITAQGSQAYQDFVKVLQHRMGGLVIKFYPVSVQGTNAVPSIIRAIKYFNELKDHPDLLVITRGGGSLEDLIAFNDEGVVRAVFGSEIPIASAVGHEGNVSLCDMAADLRASTPSNAAELIAQDKNALLQNMNARITFIDLFINQELIDHKQKIATLQHRIHHNFVIRLNEVHRVITKVVAQLTALRQTIHKTKEQTVEKENALQRLVTFTIREQKTALKTYIRLLKSLHYKNVIKRGYSITVGTNRKVVRTTNDVAPQSKLKTIVYDGTIQSIVESVNKHG